jgi:hypothetical protein
MNCSAFERNTTQLTAHLQPAFEQRHAAAVRPVARRPRLPQRLLQRAPRRRRGLLCCAARRWRLRHVGAQLHLDGALRRRDHGAAAAARLRPCELCLGGPGPLWLGDKRWRGRADLPDRSAPGAIDDSSEEMVSLEGGRRTRRKHGKRIGPRRLRWCFRLRVGPWRRGCRRTSGCCLLGSGRAAGTGSRARLMCRSIGWAAFCVGVSGWKLRCSFLAGARKRGRGL